MKHSLRIIVLFLIVGVLLPFLWIQIAFKSSSMTAEKIESNKVKFQAAEKKGTVLVNHNGTLKNMILEDYVTGVVLAEMPAEFESEALKAQAVVARTFACKAISSGVKHKEFSVCTDSSCCQGYISETEYLNKTKEPQSLVKIKDAVSQTEGIVILYDGALIETAYFSCSGGKTEDAAAVWGYYYPYLVSRNSPGEEQAFCYRDEKIYGADELMSILNITLPGNSNEWFQNWKYTNGDGVESVEIGGRIFTGIQLRSLLGLRSTMFTVDCQGDNVIFRTLGYGHRVGMSQYGADAMACLGKSYADILKYYYDGIELMTLDNIPEMY